MVSVVKAPSGRVGHETALRLDRFFAGFGLADDRARRALVRRFGQGGSAEHALARASAAAGHWFARIAGRESLSTELSLAMGRVAWLTAIHERDRGAFLADKIPDELAERLRAAMPRLPPAGLPATMPAANLRRPTRAVAAAAIHTA